MNKTIEYYDKNAETFVEGTISADMTDMYAFFQKYCLPGGVILDFGCGSGRDIKYFLEQGYIVEAIDGSKELCKIASQNSGINVENKLFNELDVIEKYDGIWACSSILHLMKEELVDVLTRIYHSLVVGGYLYTSFKYGDFSGDRNGRYFSDFTEESFKQILSNVPGLELIETMITSDVRPGRENEKWLNVIIKRNY